MFGFSSAANFLQGSTQRTWNCVTYLASLFWNKFNHISDSNMPRSRKRHHSRSRSKTRSRSVSRDRSYDRKRAGSHEKDGKRRRVDDIVDSPQTKRSISANDDMGRNERVQDVVDESDISKPESNLDICDLTVSDDEATPSQDYIKNSTEVEGDVDCNKNNDMDSKLSKDKSQCNKDDTKMENIPKKEVADGEKIDIQMQVIYDKKDKPGVCITPKKALTPKQLQKKIESEKKKQQKQKEREERDRQKQEDKERQLAEKQRLREEKEAERLRLLEEKQRQLEMKQKEKELKQKEREEQEAQKRKEKEEERLKKLQEIEEKNREKKKEEEKKQKTAALFKNFFKKTKVEERESKVEKINSNFMPFEVKSDMRLPPLRREPLSLSQRENLESIINNQDENASYIKDLNGGKIQPGKSSKTWPYEDSIDDEVTVIEEDKNLGETICEDASAVRVRKMKAKFLHFHENRRPAYFGTWRKKSKYIKPRRPFDEDTDYFNYEEDSDDDWEEEEQGESLDVSGDDDEKETENGEDEYEVDNEFFVPHGHLSEDEMDDEENARLSPESLKQKLKLLKEEFDEDHNSKTHKLKPRSIGCIWFNKKYDNVEGAIYRYFQPFAIICSGQIEIKQRSDLVASPSEKKKVKFLGELPSEHVPYFLKIINGNVHKKRTVVEEFLTFMANNGFNVEVSKANLIRFIRNSATYKRCLENGPMKNKFGWFVNDDVKAKYNVKLEVSNTAV